MRDARRWRALPADSRDEVFRQAAAIIAAVRAEGDAAVRRFTQQFGGAALDDLRVSAAEFREARAALRAGADRRARARDRQRDALSRSAAFARRCRSRPCPACAANASRGPSTASGSTCPRARRPLPSTAIMLAVPARIAGCKSRAIASSPGPDGKLHAAVLVAAELCGVDTVYKMGGAQAIAALAFGTDSVRKVDKIFGPGSAWVTAAKQIVAADPAGAAIDLPAGPSEVLVIADDSANARFVAADLLAQAEHDTIAQVVLVTDLDSRWPQRWPREVDAQIAAHLSRRDIVAQSMANSRCILVARPRDGRRGFERIRARAPHHPDARSARAARAGVERGLGVPRRMVARVHGRLLLGHQSRAAHFRLRAQLQRSVAARLSRSGSPCRNSAPTACARSGPPPITLSGMEGLDAHGNAVKVRLDALAGGRA